MGIRGFSSAVSGEFGDCFAREPGKKKREKRHSLYAICAHLFQGSIL